MFRILKAISLLLIAMVMVTGTVSGQNQASSSLAGDGQVRLPDIGDPASGTLSVAQERRLGEELVRDVRLRVPLSDDPELRDYIQDLGNRLLSQTESPDFNFEFFVVDSPAINAFAMPGGYVGINSGLVMRAESESELAAVMAHEIAHVTQRHIARSMDANRGSGLRMLGVMVAAILLGMQDVEMGSAAAMSGMASSVQNRINYTRTHEREADNIGIRILASAELDPQGMPRFFERLDQATQYIEQPPEFLSTHPVTQTRVAESRARAQSYGRIDVRESAMFGFMRARLIAAKADTPENAQRHFRAAMENGTDGQKAAARYGLALTLIKLDQPGEARKLLDALLETEGEHVPFYAALAEAARKAGNAEEGRELYRLGLTLFPNNYPLTIGLANALIDDNKPKEARSLVRQQLQRQGPDMHLYQLHARAAAAAERPHESKLAMAEYYQMHGQLRLAVDQLSQVADAADAEINDRSRAVSRRNELVRLFESREQQ
ncbi:MAG: M48 family metalloprotease [Aquisalimonadaceae bacterium]